MKRFMGLILLLVCVISLVGCSRGETVTFHGKTFYTSALSRETIEWLAWYNGLDEEKQLAVSYIPADLYELCGYGNAADVPAETK